jgi:beta-glucosidase
MSRTALRAAGPLILSLTIGVGGAGAQDTKNAPYLNTSLSPQVRAADLVHRMTLEEKASQLVNQARAIQRLGVPAYDWWSESLHGVARDGTTEFPEPVGLAATFDTAAIHEMAAVIGVEGRIKHALAEAEGHSNIFEGLDFWAPNVNIFRDPRWGRGQETYGEDPHLTARMAVAFVTGLQGDDARYYLAIATPKHFAVHSGPEPTRHFTDVDVSKHDQEDTYLPAFRAAVVEGHAGSVMCAYNAVNGEPACASQFLLQRTLRGAWQFRGYVVSDCSAVRDIFSGHRYRPTQAQSSAISLERGMDNECIDFLDKVQDDRDYRPYFEAVHQGYLSEGAIDTALVRLFTARMRLGMFDPASQVPYSKLDPSRLDSAAHRSMARRLAGESMVLLKNDGVLPLRSVKRIAVVGPLAEQTAVLLGNYNGIPSHTVSVLEGLKAEFTGAQITYVPGIQFLSTHGDPVPAARFTTPEGKPGVQADYGLGTGIGSKSTLLLSRTDSSIDLSDTNLPQELKGKSAFSVHWTGNLTPNETGDFVLGMQADGYVRVSLAGQHFIQTAGPGADLGRIHLEKGRPVSVEVEYGQTSHRKPEARMIWAPAADGPDRAAIAAVREADVVVAVVGITSRLEGEEMPVDQPGFSGGDRTNLAMPAPEEELLHAVWATHKPLVVVLTNGSAMGVTWEKEHANAILDAWYPGEEGGAAIAETLSGKINPAGRLPVTFYKDVHQLPHFEDYSMKGRTYRYFAGEPLWAFGYGLSYTTFKYSRLTLPRTPINAGDPLDVAVTVTNSGNLAGDEVAQLYLKFPDVPDAPIRALRGFQRIHLSPGASQRVEFHLQSRDLSMVTDAGDIIVAQGKYKLSVGGGQPIGDTPAVTGDFEINGQVVLPE